MSNDPGKPKLGEQFFQQSIADLSRRLADRAGRQSVPDPQARAEARRRAMQAYDRERTRKLRLVLTGVGAVFATVGIAWTVVMLGQTETTASRGPIASAPLSPPAVVAASVAPEPPQRVEAAATTDIQPPPEPAQAAPSSAPPAPAPQTASADAAPQGTASAPSAPAEAEPVYAAPPPLDRPEIREVQKRLRDFGFDPGPADGVAGRQTEIATQHYLEARGQPQMPPTDRQLLDQLRQDPTVAQAAPPPPAAPTQMVRRARQDWHGAQASAAQPAARRSFDPFQPVKYAGTEITRWLSTVFR